MRVLGQRLMKTNDQCATGLHHAFYLLKNRALLRVIEVGKNKIAAQYQIKESCGYCLANILLQETDIMAVFWPKAIIRLLFSERLFAPFYWEVLDAAV